MKKFLIWGYTSGFFGSLLHAHILSNNVLGRLTEGARMWRFKLNKDKCSYIGICILCIILFALYGWTFCVADKVRWKIYNWYKAKRLYRRAE